MLFRSFGGNIKNPDGTFKTASELWAEMENKSKSVSEDMKLRDEYARLLEEDYAYRKELSAQKRKIAKQTQRVSDINPDKFDYTRVTDLEDENRHLEAQIDKAGQSRIQAIQSRQDALDEGKQIAMSKAVRQYQKQRTSLLYKNGLLNSKTRKLLAQVQRNMRDRKSTRLNSSHIPLSRMPSSA